MDVRRTTEWKRAEQMYSELHATLAFPAFGRPSPKEIEESLAHMLRECPEFYPARIEVGLHRLVNGTGPSADKDIEAGFRGMLKLTPRAHLEREAGILVDNLEKLWRFDLCKTILETLVSRHPRNAALRDSIGHAAVWMGAVDEALVHAGKAVKADPTNDHYWSNLGWIHLIAGNLDEAATALKRALDLDSDNEAAQANRDVLCWLQARGTGTYLDYLLRPADRAQIAKAIDAEDWEQADALRGELDQCRLEAVVQTLLAGDAETRAMLPSLVSTLRQFLDFVRQVSLDEHWLQEDAGFVAAIFKPLMHKFIFKFGDIDHAMLEDVCAALLAYYRTLAKLGVISGQSFRALDKVVLGLKPELIKKMEKYNAVRHDPSVPEEKKEALREEIFEGDHAWPHL